MFATAAKNLVEEVDPGGVLVPSSSLNDSVALLTVVVKRKRFWFWQKAKCIPTDFTLNDLLTGDTPIEPVVLESDFTTYVQTCGDHVKGGVDAAFVRGHLNLEGKESFKLQSSFGSLKKQEVDVRRLFRASKGRVLDMSHSLIQQIMQKKKQIFSLVKERIVTTQPCSVVEEVQRAEQCGGMLGLCGPTTPKLQLKENGYVSRDSNVTMEIPPHTTLAYGLIELEVKRDGRYELCLMPDTTGGFEMDSASHAELLGSGACSSNSDLKTDLERLAHHFQRLQSLPASTRLSLLQHVTKHLEDRLALGAFDGELELMCLGKSTATDSPKKMIQSTLQLLEASCGEDVSPVLVALQLVTSALCEMRSDSLAALGTCCSPAELKFLEQMVSDISGSGQLDLEAPPQDVYTKAQRLFGWSRVSLTRDGDTLKTETQQAEWNFLLITCIAIRGLFCLSL
ncbi:gasdermin-E-like isoform X2 [Synchiropus splendidus]|uniref:gasdermin-E-like isoform X2 n=1 Tax=Synchiropus splendidus TaxID=270530 RepID=UPI00237D6FD9|nr:gasdermin-E-like isoform X2 [Synchiropus splendidus]